MTCVDKVCAETYLTPVSSTVKTKYMIIINPPKNTKLDRSLDNEERSLCIILLNLIIHFIISLVLSILFIFLY
jgi:hypothetical protein